MYNPKSCNALEKPFYKPIEAALRWCNLIIHEAAILTAAGDEIVPSVRAFPQWPCLRANAEKIVDAMYSGDLQYGRDGKTVCPGEQVAKPRRTVRHTDLKAWMAKHYPDQKPAFLFDEIERTTHAAVNVEAFQALQADRDALKARLEKAESWWEQEGRVLKGERDEWRAKYEQAEAEEKPSYRLAVAALMELLKSPVERLRPQGMNQAAIKKEILGRFTLHGLKDRNLDEIFAAANKALKDAE